MPVVDYEFIPVKCEDPDTWPLDLSRDLILTGINAYDNVRKAMHDLTEKEFARKAPAMESLLLSEIEEEINHNFNFVDVYYTIDPVPYIMQKMMEQKKTFKDDYFNAGNVRLRSIFPHPQVFFACPKFHRFDFGHNHQHFIDNLMVANLAVAASCIISFQIVLSSIYPPVYNPYGIYSVRLYIKQEGADKLVPAYVLIDDCLPIRGNAPAMTQWKECWFFLVQKAICKLHAFRKGINMKLDPSLNYSALKDASASVSMYFGIHSEKLLFYDGHNEEECWQSLIEGLKIRKAPFYITFAKKIYIIIDAAEYRTDEYAHQRIRLVRWHEPLAYWANYDGPYSWKDEESWKKIPEDVQKNTFQVQRFKVADKHFTYWSTFDEYLVRSRVVKITGAVQISR